MRRMMLVLLAFLPFLLGADAPPPMRVWVIGDSNGWFLMRKELPDLARADGIVLGGNPVGGTSIPWWADRRGRRNLEQMARFRPTVVVAILGTNDAFLGPYFIQRMPPQLRYIRKKVEDTGARLVWVGPPRLPRRATKGADMFREMIVREGLPMFDSRSCHFPMWSDGIHPSVGGRKIWARWIWQNLNGKPVESCGE